MRIYKSLLHSLIAICFALSPSMMRAQGGDSIPALSTDSLPPVPYEQHVTMQLDSLIAGSALMQTSQLGLMVWDLDADSLLYSHNPRHRMRPASTMKLVTAITALDLYGENHSFNTEIRYLGPILGHTLRGDILCVGDMDPSFDNGDLRVIVDRIRAAGIDTICGRIVDDKSMKDELLLGEGWCWDDDNPTLSALLVERKDNFVERLTKEIDNVGIVRIDTVIPPAEKKAKKGGSTPHFGGFRISHSITQILRRMMKSSDNLYAEAMFYHIALKAGRPATVKNARSEVKQLIKRIGLDPSEYTIADGSGLSLYNYVSPELLTALLRHAYSQERIRTALLPSLPVAGVDGTLKSRMKKSPAYNNVQAKTGTVSGISSLAGYCSAPNGHRIAFTIINQGVKKANDGRDFQDKVCDILTAP